MAVVGERDLEFGICAELILTKVELLGEVSVTVTCLNKIIVVIADNFHAF